MKRALWESRIREAWQDAVAPGKRVVRDCFELNPSPATYYDCEPIDAQNLLSGKRWDDIEDDDDRLGIEMPFFYLTAEASAYFLGGYLLYICGVWDHGSVDLPAIHAIWFLGSERFDEVISFLSENQKAVISLFALVIVEEREVFRLSDKDLTGLKSAAQKLGLS